VVAYPSPLGEREGPKPKAWEGEGDRRLVRLALLLLLLALPGCREDEQGRSIHFHKGSYAGPPVPPLSDAQIARLQQRAMQENE
jgi:hypothetical protein